MCLKCLDPQPQERYESIEELRADLSRCAAGKRPALGGSDSGWAAFTEPFQKLRQILPTGAKGSHATSEPSRLDFLAKPISGRPLWQYAAVILTLILALLVIAVILTP